jgi:5-methylcytosine-specific restriction protein B
VFHQNAKHREFITGLVPRVAELTGSDGGATQFVVQEGTLYRASEHAKQPDAASLLVIDEINRGPAVQLFGGAIVPFERDKRLKEDGSPGPETAAFELIRPPDGTLVEYELPLHLYTLAAMNEADTSVEPLDVAFLRRWRPYSLRPSTEALEQYFGVAAPVPAELPKAPNSPQDVFRAAIAAWQKVNSRIGRGRGPEFQIGHGVLMGSWDLPTTAEAAAAHLYERWSIVQAHIQEVFFGDIRAVAEVLGAEEGAAAGHPYRLESYLFGDEMRFELVGPELLEPSTLYAALRSIAISEDRALT